MSEFPKTLGRLGVKFVRGRHGTVTAESVIWLPVYLMMLALVFDGTALFVGHTDMWSIARHALRMVALGKLTPEQAEAWVEAAPQDGVVLVAEVASDGLFVTTEITRAFSNVTILGPLSGFGGEFYLTSRYRVEPTL